MFDLKIVLIVIAAGLLAAAIVALTRYSSGERRAGREGERLAASAIKKVLRDDDVLLRNVKIKYDGKPAELDNVIVNECGVFIIEVKNYSGRLKGSVDDFSWTKYHRTAKGNVYSKKVKNPIKQVNRQVYILAHYLRQYGIKLWVVGYVYLINDNSPVNSETVLSDSGDIYTAIHKRGERKLDKQTIDTIVSILH